MTSRPGPRLSKSRFSSGLQCLKRLYFECFKRDLADPITPEQQALFDSGTAVGELARDRFSPGVWIAESYLEHGAAVQHTEEAMMDGTVKALYEAAFSFEGINIRADILVRNDDGTFDLIEVKSSTSFKAEHLPDVAIQLHVIEGLGYSIRRVALMHIDNSYVYVGGEHDLARLFALEDATEEARAFGSSEVPPRLAEMWEAIQGGEEPAIEIGAHCSKPYVCAYYGHCHQDEPEHGIEQLPSASAKLLGSLRSLGIHEIPGIPDGFSGLTEKQKRVRDAVITGDPFESSDLQSVLGGVTYPIHFLDFETIGPAVPLYIGTSPYKQIPFQWSVHTLDASQELSHFEYLHSGRDDPREKVATTLLNTLGSEGSIVVYSGFEEARIKELAEAVPQYRDPLLRLCDRLLDLHKVLSAHYYHPNFHGSWSIKSVLPALVPELSYDDLDIKGGSAASFTFAQTLDPNLGNDEKRLRQESLLAYCKRDTEAMVRVFQELQTPR